MTALTRDADSESETGFSPAAERRALAVALGAHALHDGYTSLITVMLPIWQAQFGLSYAAIGLLRAAVHGTLAAFQIPAGRLSERVGTRAVLGIGTLLAGICFCVAGVSVGFASLLVALCVGGLGASTQHPTASALVANVFAGSRSMSRLGVYNFAGDVGKMLLPVAATLLMTVVPWRVALALLGSLGVAGAVLIFIFTPRLCGKPPALRSRDTAPHKRISDTNRRAGFAILFSIGLIDSATSTSFLTFLPFLLASKGASLPTIGFALALLFAGGAVGKLVCTFIGVRIGTFATVCLSEALTAVGIFVLLPLPLELDLVILPVIGIALNGTSSVLYGSVPQLVAPEKRARAFGVFYTGTIGSGAVAPFMYGLLGDIVGVPTTLAIIAAAVFLTLPLAIALRPSLRDNSGS